MLSWQSAQANAEQIALRAYVYKNEQVFPLEKPAFDRPFVRILQKLFDNIGQMVLCFSLLDLLQKEEHPYICQSHFGTGGLV